MRRVFYLMTILLMSSLMAHADETITVSATNSDIAANLDLKVVAKLFGEAKDLEDFEQRLNNPDSAFVNLDLNGDGDVDYIRVIETTSGNKHLIVLQAVLAKDIYQDVASIYVEKDEANNVSVQVIGDEYIYGENYVIEPVYIYRPVIYDWFWSPYWVCWNSPWYWGYWPVWWHTWGCIHYWAYWDHCYHFHHHHHGCSFHYAKTARPAYHEMRDHVGRSDYAKANPGRSFAERNEGMTNARQLPVTTRAGSSNNHTPVQGTAGQHPVTTTRRPAASDRTYGSSFTQTARPTTATTQRNGASQHPATTTTTRKPTTTTTTTTTRSSGSSSTVRTSQGTVSTTRRPSTVTTTTQRPTTSTTTTTQRPSTSTTSTTRSGSTTTRSSSTTTQTYRPSSTSGTTQSSHGTFGGGTAPRGGSGGGGGGASPRGGGGGASPRR